MWDALLLLAGPGCLPFAACACLLLLAVLLLAFCLPAGAGLALLAATLLYPTRPELVANRTRRRLETEEFFASVPEASSRPRDQLSPPDGYSSE